MKRRQTRLASMVYDTAACIFLFLGAYSFGLTPVMNIHGPGVLLYNIRGTGMTMVFPYLFQSLGLKTYMVNASCNILFWVFIWFSWVETKGKTLEDINKLSDGEKHSDITDLDMVKDEQDLELNVEQVIPEK
ncbi:Uu.00g012820.m01.CDS01 [Anthostomella pinea]|uniref:Uu.00g012820.m01.CDS01 n=1 Tax=Anthostomella pinea TaxID=933095 RepID=A0AAI8VY10_9PEZI|nr:Uu.00g012820.m01.CDS01 [Anthostomella pinea]